MRYLVKRRLKPGQAESLRQATSEGTMHRDNPSPVCHRETRRQCIKKAGVVAAAVAGANLLPLPLSARENSPAVSIVLEASDPVAKQPPVQWAVEQLHDILTARGI